MFIKSDCQSYTPTFGAMKKSQFKGLDLVCVNTFKAPIEKFNSNADLQSWAKNKLDTDIFTKNLEGRTFRATAERQSTLESWKNFIEKSKDLTAASALFILSAIFGKLSSKTDDVPPPINVDSVSKTLADIEKNPEINFQKEYLKNLKKHLMDFDIDNYTGWIIIPSNARTEEEFNKNLETLKLLSHHSWCTKSTRAEDHLRQGNFHIYYENGHPKIGVQMTYPTEVHEIQGSENNCSLAPQYVDIMEKHIQDCHLTLTENANDIFSCAKIAAERIKTAKEKLNNDIETKNYKNIMKYFSIDRQENPDGTVILDKYNDYINYSLLGIDVQDMLKDVTEITGNADFRNCPATKLPNLKKVGGYANFSDSKIKELPNLQSIGSFGTFRNCATEQLPSLQSCPSLDLTFSKIKELPAFNNGTVTANFEVNTPSLK